ncbi:MAG: hypothetical protein HUK21_00935 [Fibrobacteraceae bacterium]|nr:hypothetical protein [Fibrobacteraceae bacterium]
MNKRILFMLLAFGALFLISCTKEDEQKTLPELPKVEKPALVGNYTGKMPDEEWEKRMVRLSLLDSGKVVWMETLVKGETVKQDTLLGLYKVENDSILLLNLNENREFRFKITPIGSLYFMTGAGTVYKDENGLPAGFIHIFDNPKK